MKDYIGSYIEILPPEQRERIISVMSTVDSQIKDTILSNMTEKDYGEMIKNVIENGDIATKKINMADRLDSSAYNSFCSQNVIDFNILYNESDVLERVVSSQSTLDIAMVDEIRHYIDELKAQIAKFKYIKKNTSFEEVFIETFKSADHILKTDQWTQDMFKDRDGSVLPMCGVDTKTGMIKLNASSQADIIKEGSATIKIYKQTSAGYELTGGYPLGNAIDGSLNTFWGNVILTDCEINVDIDGIRGGAICILDIEFTKKMRVSDIALSFYGVFPVTIEKLMYKPVADPGYDFVSLIDKPSESQNGKASFNFKPTNMQQIRIALRQKNYEKVVYSLFSDQVKDNETIKKVLDAEIEKAFANSSLTQEDVNELIGYNEWKEAYDKFLDMFEAFNNALKAQGFNWTEEQITEYIKANS